MDEYTLRKLNMLRANIRLYRTMLAHTSDIGASAKLRQKINRLQAMELTIIEAPREDNDTEPIATIDLDRTG